MSISVVKTMLLVLVMVCGYGLTASLAPFFKGGGETSSSLDFRDGGFRTNPVSFAGMDNLKELDLGDNELTTVPSDVVSLRSLESLYLDWNRLKELPDDFARLENLKILDISFNRFQTFPRQVLSLPSLEKLDVSGNRIRELPDEIVKLSGLKELTIYSSPLRHLPARFGEFQSLRRLSLGSSQLETPLAEVLKICEIRTLTHLRLYIGGLKRLPEQMKHLTQLRKLDLRGHRFADLVGVIDILAKLPHLEELVLDDCGIRAVPSNIVKLRGLKYLSLWDNEIDEFGDSVKGMKSLRYLYVVKNNLTEEAVMKLQALLPMVDIVHSEDQRRPLSLTDGDKGRMMYGSVNLLSLRSLYQRWRAPRGSIGRIQIQLSRDSEASPMEPERVSVELLTEKGTLIARATRELTKQAAGWVEFDFVPAEVFFSQPTNLLIAATCGEGHHSFHWLYSSERYPDGGAILMGQPIPADFRFKVFDDKLKPVPLWEGASSAGSAISFRRFIGMYRKRDDKSSLAVLRPSGSFFVIQSGQKLKGTYKIRGNRLDLITSTAKVRGRIQNGVMYDSDGEAWDKVMDY